MIIDAIKIISKQIKEASSSELKMFEFKVNPYYNKHFDYIILNKTPITVFSIEFNRHGDIKATYNYDNDIYSDPGYSKLYDISYAKNGSDLICICKTEEELKKIIFQHKRDKLLESIEKLKIEKENIEVEIEKLKTQYSELLKATS